MNYHIERYNKYTKRWQFVLSVKNQQAADSHMLYLQNSYPAEEYRIVRIGDSP